MACDQDNMNNKQGNKVERVVFKSDNILYTVVLGMSPTDFSNRTRNI